MTQIRRVARVEARLEPFAWAWPDQNAALVSAHWQARSRSHPGVFNGRVLMVSDLAEADGILQAHFFETDYAAMLAWITHGFPGAPVWNGFAMGALRCRDGGYLLGRMAEQTANAGQLYFPCGTPDRDDLLPGGGVDLAGSIHREIAEETGLTPADYALDPSWVVAEDRGYLAFLREGRLELTAREVRERVTSHLAAEARPELAGIEIVSRPEELEEAAMPGVVKAFLREALARARA
ncbi:NUDIX domain-containing protein [uncultured Enterovirga sp.]|uniref:NUDIX domain-containing protein n=1 Tax=uncultured Enterovirga sp. TaxID=2026352 RepID=UPI0035CC01BA